MDQVIRTVDNTLNATLDTLIRKPHLIRGLVHLLIILYATKMAPELPKKVMDLFENQYFRLFVFSLILWTAQFSPSTSILLALAFMMTVNYSMSRPLWEMMDNVVEPEKAPETVTPPEAVVALANAASSEQPAPQEKVEEAAKIAATAVKTDEGAQAVVALAQQAMAPEAGEKEKVQEAAQVAVDSMVPQPAPAAGAPAPVAAAPAEVPAKGGGCYPMRRYDLSQLTGYSADNEYGSFGL